jgi:acyl-CoA synthetase (AMP-forming)/AMP-acid ligase II
LGNDPGRRGCIWLPPYHDMGLLGGILQPLFSGFPLVFMSPLQFVQRPVRWLRAISEHRATLSGAPNFAYRMCATDIPEADLEGLDLSCWTQAFCGAEPVHAETMNAFCRRFARFGFVAESVNPCYGLAESTLIVSGKQAGQAPTYATFDRARLEQGVVAEAVGADVVALTGCGRVTGGHDVRVVDPATGVELAPGQLGEIWVAGPSVAGGYWGRPDLTQEVFGRTLEGSAARYLDTGDRGFFCDGQLYLAGRSKDMIIIDGKNHYPEDIERTVESTHELLFSGGSVAFAVEAGEQEAMVVVAELRKQEGYDEQHTRSVTARILERVTAVHGVAPRQIVLCRRGAIARTTSGKVRRSASRALYLEGGLQPIREWSRPEPRMGA